MKPNFLQNCSVDRNSRKLSYRARCGEPKRKQLKNNNVIINQILKTTSFFADKLELPAQGL